MRESFMTLWDLLKESMSAAPSSESTVRNGKSAPRKGKPGERNQKAVPQSGKVELRNRKRLREGERKTIRAKPGAAQPVVDPGAPKHALTMQDRYDRMTKEMLQQYGVRVRKWRTSMSGIAWELRYKDGRISRLIESPRPKGPMSAAVFLHEIGHHAIGFNVYRPRCLEEYHAWAFALEQMESLGLNITDAVHKRMHLSLRYAVQKAQRRGIKKIPPELVAFTQPWRGKRGG